MATAAAAPAMESKGAARPKLGPLALLAAPMAWISVFYLVPLGLLLLHAFWSVDYLTIDRTLTLDNLRTVSENPLYPTVLLRTFLIAAAVTLTDIVLAFPIAFYIAKRATKHRELLLMLVVFPLWSSYLVRAFAWKTILGTNGILNSFLLTTGIVSEPVSAFLYSKTGMYITFCQVWLPFMILPLYTILDRMPNSLLEAASDLGANWWQTFRRVILPLSLPGLLAGSLSVFSLTMGDYITPSLIGGSAGTELIGGIIADQFGMANNWPLGAALILPVLAIISVFLLLANKAGALGRGEAGMSAGSATTLASETVAPAALPASAPPRRSAADRGWALPRLCVYLFLYLPLFVVVLYSFSATKVNAWPIKGYTLDWYRELMVDRDIQESVRLSVLIGLIAAGIAVVLGTLTAFALDRFNFPGKPAIRFFVVMPIVLPGIVTGVAHALLLLDAGLAAVEMDDHHRPRDVLHHADSEQRRGETGPVAAQPGRSVGGSRGAAQSDVLAGHVPADPARDPGGGYPGLYALVRRSGGHVLPDGARKDVAIADLGPAAPGHLAGDQRGGDNHHCGVAGRRASLEPAFEAGGSGRLDAGTGDSNDGPNGRERISRHLSPGSWDGPASNCGTSPSSSARFRRSTASRSTCARESS